MTIVTVIGVSVLLTFIFILSNSDDEGDLTNNPADNNTNISVIDDNEPININEDDSTIAKENTQDSTEPTSSETGVQGLDGIVYDAFVEYLAPKGHRDSIDVQLSLDESGVVVNANVDYVADNEDSKFYQSKFESAYKDEVIGKKIEEIDLSRVGGASLTSAAFMEAVEEIKSKI